MLFQMSIVYWKVYIHNTKDEPFHQLLDFQIYSLQLCVSQPKREEKWRGLVEGKKKKKVAEGFGESSNKRDQENEYWA